MILFFSHRRKLALLCDKWVKENDLAHNTQNVIAFLVLHGLIDVEAALQLIAEDTHKNEEAKA